MGNHAPILSAIVANRKWRQKSAVSQSIFSTTNQPFTETKSHPRGRRGPRKYCATCPIRVIVVYRYIDHRSNMPKRKFDPLPSAAFQILLSLCDEDLHGYAIMRQVEEQTSGRMRLGPGTLYNSIGSLLEEKLIEEVGSRENATLGDERRRYYRLTSAGRKLARSEAERLADLLRVARAKNILRGDCV